MSALPDNLRCWAEIDLSALERNLKNIRAALPRRLHFVSVVKADAYGHGLRPIAQRLMHAGADLFAIANVSEGAALRESGAGWPALVLSPVLRTEIPELFHFDLMPSVSSAAELDWLESEAIRRDRNLSYHLKIDTGMGRAGVWHEDAHALLKMAQSPSRLQLAGVYTHFASADSDAEFTGLQRRRFQDVLIASRLPLESLLLHADNSAGIDQFPVDSPLNGVRIGLAQFGVCPHKNTLLSAARVDPVLSLRARVTLVKNLPAGTSVSYGRTYVANQPIRIAVLGIGYADGLSTAQSGRAQVIINGCRCPILGRVTMDQTVVDVTHLPAVSPGATATLLGSDSGETISIQEFAACSNKIEWEAYCGIGSRVQRLYRLDSAL